MIILRSSPSMNNILYDVDEMQLGAWRVNFYTVSQSIYPQSTKTLGFLRRCKIKYTSATVRHVRGTYEWFNFFFGFSLYQQVGNDDDDDDDRQHVRFPSTQPNKR